MFLLSICQWVDSTRLNAVLRQSNWAFPILDTIHTLGIVLVAGTIMLVDLRLLGLALRSVPIAQIGGAHRSGDAVGLRIDVRERRSAVHFGSREDVS